MLEDKLRSGLEAVEVESLESAVLSSLVMKGEQKVLQRDESKHWPERRSFMKLCSAPREFVERSVSRVGSVEVGSVIGGLGVRKFWVSGRTLLASNCVKEVENSTGV